jgi:outer membrane protein assembly factor BamA
MKRLVFLFCLIFSTLNAFSQKGSDSLNRNSLKGFPVVFYSPETRLGLGGAGVYSFHHKNDSGATFPSSVSLIAMYTMEKQTIVYAPFNLYFKQSKYWLYGEIGYYDYFYYFFGIGNSLNEDYKELYSASFIRGRLSALVKPNNDIPLYLGLKYAYDKINMKKTEAGGLLSTPEIIGSTDGTVSGLGLVANFDSRNHVFYPSKGSFVEVFGYYENKITGSSFDYSRLTIDASHFISLASQHVLAFNYYGVTIFGDAPFTHLGQLGGLRKMRGYYEGRYRDNVAMCAQAEWRFKFAKNWGVHCFGGSGIVAPELSALKIDNTRFTAGTGIRFRLDKKQNLNLRADFAVGKKSHGFYFTIGEAF